MLSKTIKMLITAAIAALQVLEEGAQATGDLSLSGQAQYLKEHVSAMCVKESKYNSDGNIKYWKEYQYDEHGNETKCIRYERGASVHYWSEREYDAMGNITKYVYYEGEESIKSWEEWEYDASGNRTKWIRDYGSKNIDEFTLYEYRYQFNDEAVK